MRIKVQFSFLIFCFGGLGIMTTITIAGCGIVGATIAYELSKVSGLRVTVVDQQSAPIEPNMQYCPSATGAALGVLMGAISTKEKGNNLRMRLASLAYYEQTVPELAALTARSIPFNRQGILMLQFEDERSPETRSRWERLIPIRAQQGWTLEWWECDRLAQQFPFLNLEGVVGAVYSPGDRQVNPVALTRALIEAAKRNGATFHFGKTVTGAALPTVELSDGSTLTSDYLVISAGLGSTALTAALGAPIEIRPVLGQAVQVRLPKPLMFQQPVITGNDVHIVPIDSPHRNSAEYWIGATVEFPTETGEVLPIDRAQFEAVMAQAIAFCPAIAQAETIRTWQGLRPRPQGRPAPIIEALPNQPQVLVASGHYRNGVLLAPATALQVKERIVGTSGEKR